MLRNHIDQPRHPKPRRLKQLLVLTQFLLGLCNMNLKILRSTSIRPSPAHLKAFEMGQYFNIACPDRREVGDFGEKLGQLLPSSILGEAFEAYLTIPLSTQLVNSKKSSSIFS